MISPLDEDEPPLTAWCGEQSPQPPLCDLRESVEGRRIRGALHARLFGSPEQEVRFGPYRLEERLGRGATGTVYRAIHDDGSTHAVKILELEGPLARSRFRREAVAASALRHPNVVSVHGHGEVGDRCYLSMDLVAGPTLAQWLEQERSVSSILGVVAMVGRGLSHAHGKGVVHRDVKPANILIGPGDVACLSDLGLVRAVGAPDGTELTGLTESLTQTGARLGTVGFMAPEQLLGRKVSAATDQFGLAATAYLAVYGQPAFEDETPELVALRILDGELSEPKVRGEHPELDRVLVRALQPEPEKRFPTVDAFIAALQRPRQPRTAWTRLFGSWTRSSTRKKKPSP